MHILHASKRCFFIPCFFPYQTESGKMVCTTGKTTLCLESFFYFHSPLISRAGHCVPRVQRGVPAAAVRPPGHPHDLVLLVRRQDHLVRLEELISFFVGKTETVCFFCRSRSSDICEMMDGASHRSNKEMQMLKSKRKVRYKTRAGRYFLLSFYAK